MNLKEYESLLMYKAQLEKDCRFIEQEYYLKFGEPLLALLKLKLACAELKAKIAYCQKMRNQGLSPNEEEMNAYAKSNCTEAYFEYISAAGKKRHAEACHDGLFLDPESMDKLRSLFRSLVKMVHPDLHPERASDPLAYSVYDHALKAYKDNDLPRLIELFDLARLHFKEEEAEIEDLEEKIEAAKEQIHEIETTNPYLYHVYLDDADKGKELLIDLSKQSQEYESFKGELEGRLALLLSRKVGEA